MTSSIHGDIHLADPGSRETQSRPTAIRLGPTSLSSAQPVRHICISPVFYLFEILFDNSVEFAPVVGAIGANSCITDDLDPVLAVENMRAPGEQHAAAISDAFKPDRPKHHQ